MNLSAAQLQSGFHKLKATLIEEYNNLLDGLLRVFHNLRNFPEFQSTYSALSSANVGDYTIEDIVEHCGHAFRGREKFIHERDRRAFEIATDMPDIEQVQEQTQESEAKAENDGCEHEQNNQEDKDVKVLNGLDLFGAMYNVDGVNSMLLFNTLNSNHAHQSKLNQLWNHLRSVLQRYSIEKLFKAMPNNMLNTVMNKLSSSDSEAQEDGKEEKKGMGIANIVKSVGQAFCESNLMDELKENPESFASCIQDLCTHFGHVQGVFASDHSSSALDPKQEAKMKSCMLLEFKTTVSDMDNLAELKESKLNELFHALYEEDSETYNSFVRRGFITSEQLDDYKDVFQRVYVTFYDGRSGNLSANSTFSNMLPPDLFKMMSSLSNVNLSDLNNEDKNQEDVDAKGWSEEEMDRLTSQLPEGIQSTFANVMSNVDESMDDRDMIKALMNGFLESPLMNQLPNIMLS